MAEGESGSRAASGRIVSHATNESRNRLEVERARYQAERAERQYRTVEPENRLVARGLETAWENRLRDLAAAEAELHRREQQRPNPLGPEQLKRLQSLGSDIRKVWDATTTNDRVYQSGERLRVHQEDTCQALAIHRSRI